MDMKSFKYEVVRFC